MPFTKCPICGELSHLNVSNIEQWYAKYYPGTPVGELVPGKCYACCHDLDASTRVVVRRPLIGEAQAPAGAHGVIERVLSAAAHGKIYLVRLDSGDELYFIRAELRKLGAAEVPVPSDL